MILAIDHVPLHTDDLDAMSEALRRLGFTVSPVCHYTSPETPEARWVNRAVFTAKGWLDLLTTDMAGPHGTPAACLFHADDLAQAAHLPLTHVTHLERRWPERPELAAEPFAYASVRARAAPLFLAVIAHAWPHPDVEPAWLEHPNGAVEVAGLVFGGARPGEQAGEVAGVLDLSRFDYWAEDRFAAAFGPVAPQRAVRVKVHDLTAVRRLLTAGGVAFAEDANAICARPPPGLACGFVFAV